MAGTTANHKQTELAEFLVAMRARAQPAELGLRDSGRRRTPGLRRQEVAELAAVSVDWYVRLEQGRVGTPGSAVLDAIADALRLTPAEREYLHLTARGEAPPRRHVTLPVADSLRAILAGMPLLPAYVIDHRFDVLARNRAAAAMFGDGFGTGDAANTALLTFLDEEMRSTQLSWEQIARETVGALRSATARHRDDRRLAEVVRLLRAQSPEFVAWWDDQTVRERSHGTKRVRHAIGGELTLAYDMLAAQDGSEQRLFVLTPADDATEQALRTIVATHARGAGGEVAEGRLLRAVGA